MKEKRVVNFPAIILSVLSVLAVSLGVYVYLALNGPDYTPTYSQRISEGIIQNPVSEFQLANENKSLSDIIHFQGISGINLSSLESKSINYMSVKLYLYNLHNIPLTNDNPRIQIYIVDASYSVEIIKGEIYVKQEITNSPDIIIKTTIDEIAKIIENPEYAKGSINSKKTTIEITGDKLTLLLKGYAKISSLLS